MDLTCTTSDHLTYVCSLGGALLDWFGLTLQGVWFVGGAVLGGGIAAGAMLFLRRV